MRDQKNDELEARRVEWRRQLDTIDERRAAYLSWKAAKLPALVALQRRMMRGENGHAVLAETARQVKT